MQNSSSINRMPEYTVTPSSTVSGNKNSGGLMLLVGFLLAALLAVGFFAYTNYTANQKLANTISGLQADLQNLKTTNGTKEVMNSVTNTITPAVVTSPAPSPSLPPATAMGKITGKLSYPAEMMPTEKVCAQNTSTGKEICQNFSKSAYELTVPPANYQVYAMVADDPSNKDFPKNTTKAFYSEFVTCGLNAKCPSHKPIEFEVKANETITGIDPQDWYAN